GVDAHSMLLSTSHNSDAIRLAMPDSLESYAAAKPGGDALASGIALTPVSPQAAWEESFFLGLRLNRGVDLRCIERQFGADATQRARNIVRELQPSDFVEFANDDEVLRLTLAGRLASNEVFEAFLLDAKVEISATRNLAPVSTT